jgi:hypothetical protein
MTFRFVALCHNQRSFFKIRDEAAKQLILFVRYYCSEGQSNVANRLHRSIGFNFFTILSNEFAEQQSIFVAKGHALKGQSYTRKYVQYVTPIFLWVLFERKLSHYTSTNDRDQFWEEIYY